MGSGKKGRILELYRLSIIKFWFNYILYSKNNEETRRKRKQTCLINYE